VESSRLVGRASGVIFALGAGAWLASVPSLATADPADTSGLDLTTVDSAISGLLPAAGTDPSGLDLSISYNGETLVQDGSGAYATTTAGSYDLAIAYGAGSTATADGVSNVAVAENGGTALSGEPLVSGVSSVSGAYEYAVADGAGSSATTGFGDSNIAEAFGTDSSAVAGLGVADASGGLANDNDLAAVFGNDLTATATGASNLYDIEPGAVTNIASDAAAAIAPGDDLGLSNLLADFSWLGL
jgi:hypothetical protein